MTMMITEIIIDELAVGSTMIGSDSEEEQFVPDCPLVLRWVQMRAA